MRRYLLAGLATALLLASGAHAKPPPQIPLEEGANDAVIYVYRTQHGLGGWIERGAAVEIDGRRLAKFPYNGCTAVRVPAGEHVVGVLWPPSLLTMDPKGRDPVEVRANLEPGGRYYFHLRVEGLMETYRLQVTSVAWNLSQVGFQEAKAPLSKCFFVKPKGGWETGPARDMTAGPRPSHGISDVVLPDVMPTPRR